MKLKPFSLAIITAALIGFGVTLFVTVAVQQNYRLSANDPQIQLAEDLASRLSAGTPVPGMKANRKVDLNTSLAVFTIIVDDRGNVVSGTAVLDGTTPLPPPGVFDLAQAHGQQQLTWQPKPGVRLALVVQPYQYKGTHGYVLIGRSLREVEKREWKLHVVAGLTLLGIVAVAGVSLWIQRFWATL